MRSSPEIEPFLAYLEVIGQGERSWVKWKCQSCPSLHLAPEDVEPPNKSCSVQPLPVDFGFCPELMEIWEDSVRTIDMLRSDTDYSNYIPEDDAEYASWPERKLKMELSSI